MEKKIIAFVGMPGAGKSTLADFLASKGIPNVYLGGVTVDEVKKRGLEVNEKNEKTVREELRTKEGLGVMAKRIIPEIEELFTKNDVVVADGIYSWSEYKIFKKKYTDNAIIIAVVSPRIERHKRLAKRPDRPLTDYEVTSREYAEIENLEKGGPIANADYTILNNDTPDFMLKQLSHIFTKEKISI